jgi:hypothetical protein
MLGFGFLQLENQYQGGVMLPPTFDNRQRKVRVEEIEIDAGAPGLLENRFRGLDFGRHVGKQIQPVQEFKAETRTPEQSARRKSPVLPALPV